MSGSGTTPGTLGVKLLPSTPTGGSVATPVDDSEDPVLGITPAADDTAVSVVGVDDVVVSIEETVAIGVVYGANAVLAAVRVGSAWLGSMVAEEDRLELAAVSTTIAKASG